MAGADLRGELNCSICLSVYKDPVMLRCGHNFCSTCIGDVLRAQEGSGAYSCPQCRMLFTEHPALQKNIALRNIAEHFQFTHPEEEPSGVLCTYCIYYPVPAVKTCVDCEASLCEVHVNVHNKSLKHVLIEPTTCLENRKCPDHKKILAFYCCEDSVCICLSCRLDGIHKGHKVESIEEAFEKKRETLKNVLEELSSQKEETANGIQTLFGHKDKVMRNADNLKKTVTDLFRGIKRKLDALEEQMLKEVYKQKEETSKSVTDLVQHLVANIEAISKKISVLEKVYSVVDPLSVLQDQGVDGGDAAGDLKALKKTSRIEKSVKNLHERMIYIELFKGLSHIVNQEKLNTLQADSDIVLDVDTAGNCVQVSKDLKTVSSTKIHNIFPVNPKRFSINQVLSQNCFSSRQHYWEVQTSTTGNWRLGVAYTSINTKGDQSPIGNNKKSWCLRRFNGKYSVMHDDDEIHFTQNISSNCFGVCLDYKAGRLDLYELRDPVRHIYTFNAVFTEPLHAAFLVNKSFVKIVKTAH